MYQGFAREKMNEASAEWSKTIFGILVVLQSDTHGEDDGV